LGARRGVLRDLASALAGSRAALAVAGRVGEGLERVGAAWLTRQVAAPAALIEQDDGPADETAHHHAARAPQPGAAPAHATRREPAPAATTPNTSCSAIQFDGSRWCSNSSGTACHATT